MINRRGRRPRNNYSGKIDELLNRQIAESERNRRDSLADRDAALGILGNQYGRRSPEFQETFDSLSADPGDTPFAQMLRSSIESTLQNPDVFTEDEKQRAFSISRENSARAVQDAMLATQMDNAGRGVQGGIQQGQMQDLTIDATSQAAANENMLSLEMAQAREANRQAAQELGVQFETATQQAREQRLATLSNYVSQAELRDLEVVTGMAEILANTVRENPDYSGYAAIYQDMNQAAQDLLIQRENLALLREEIRVQERLGIANANAQFALARAQRNYARQLSSLERQLAEVSG